jgi:hypothetical protein
MRLASILIVTLCTALLLGACSQSATIEPTQPAELAVTIEPSQPVVDSESPYPIPPVGNAYPAPTEGPAYPVPEPVVPTVNSEPLQIPEPSSSEVGVVSGTLFRTDNMGGQQPLVGSTIYLGVVLPDQASGTDLLVALDKNEAPRTSTNGLGQFAFVDVPPGRYGLMVDTINGAVLLGQPDTGADMIVEVVGGQTFEMGEMGYPLP